MMNSMKNDSETKNNATKSSNKKSSNKKSSNKKSSNTKSSNTKSSNTKSSNIKSKVSNIKESSHENRVADICFYILFGLLIVYIGFLCFFHLEASGIQNWDEARHGINAYEMLQTKNIWISTYNYEVDYFNFKPPLSMWMIMLNFTLFGINTFAMRIGSAFCTLALCLVAAVFLKKEFGRVAALYFLLFFTFYKDMLFFHMSRSGDADSIYLFFFVVGMICLYYASITQKKKRNPWYFFYGLCCSLCFMAKAVHAVLLLIIGFFYLLNKELLKNNRLTSLLRRGLSILLGFFPVVIWGIIRYRFDGFLFIRGMFMKEVVERVQKGKDYTGYIADLSADWAVLFMIFLVILAAVFGLTKNSTLSFKQMTAGTSLTVLWIVVPLAVYSLSGTFMPWYSYTIRIAIAMYSAILCGRLIRKIHARAVIVILNLCLAVGLVFSLAADRRHFRDIFYDGNQDFRVAIHSVMEEHPEYVGSPVYIENDRNEWEEQNNWEQNLMLEALFAGNLQCIDGGVSSFLQAEEGLMVVSKNLISDYVDVLAGRVILWDDDGYLIFSRDLY